MIVNTVVLETQNEIPSNKSFGIVFAALFVLIALYPLLDGEGLRLWAVGVAFMFGGAAYLAPNLLVLPNQLWFKFGIALGTIVAPIVMGLVYFSTVVPIGLVIRLLRKDLLNKKLDSEMRSYWIERKQPVGSMEEQF